MFRAFVYVRKIHEQQRWHRRNSCHHTYKSTSKWNVRITMTMLLYFREWWILWQRLQYATQCFYHDQRIVIELTTESCEVDNYSWQQGSMEPGISYAVLYFFFKMVNVPEGRNTFPSTACNISGCVQLEVGQFLQMCDMQVIVYYIKQMTNGVVALIRQSSGQFAVHK